MQANFPAALDAVLAHEGGFVNHPSDPGGATNKGVTLATYRVHFGPDATVDDLKNITNAQLLEIYRKGYWNAIRGDDLPSGLDYALFDYAVNSGPYRAVMELQSIIGVADDGAMGPLTLKAIGNMSVQHLIERVCDRRMVFLMKLSHWPTFGTGWSKRVDGVRKKALQMAGEGDVPAPVDIPTPTKKPKRPNLLDWWRSRC